MTVEHEALDKPQRAAFNFWHGMNEHLARFHQEETLSLDLSFRLDQIGLNATNTFLVYTEEDMGELLKIKLTWEGTSQSWYDLWKELKSYWYRPAKAPQELHIRRIRVKSGETQQR